MKDYFRKKEFSISHEQTRLLEEKYGISNEVAQLMIDRGFELDTDGFCDVDKMGDPFLMNGMHAAAAIVRDVIDAEASVLVYGDYDADGISAAAILKLFLESQGVSCDVLLPTREMGYGLHVEPVVKRHMENPFDLLITVDCGIANHVEIQQIQEELGVEVLVTDHHEMPETLPDCVCINCKWGYDFPYLSGSAVALKLVEALSDRETALYYADLATVGIIADLMPLTGENRIIVKHGLANVTHKGLDAMLKVANCTEPYTVYDFSMKICPRINAAGRVDDPTPALEVMLADRVCPRAVAERLTVINDMRKQLVEEMISMAKEQISPEKMAEEDCIFVVGEDWKHGILGIVASRYREKYKIPAFVLTRSGDCYVGSGRGTDDFSLFEVLKKIGDKTVRYGGHKRSVGFTVECSRLDEFREALVAELNSCVKRDFYYYYDLDFKPEYATEEFFNLLKKLEPMAVSDAVLMRVSGVAVEAALFGANRNHLAVKLENGLYLKGFFDFARYYPFIKAQNTMDYIFTLEYDAYEKCPVGVIKAVQPRNSVRLNEFYERFFMQNVRRKNLAMLRASGELGRLRMESWSFVDKEQTERLLQKKDITAVFFSYEEMLAVQAKEGFDFDDFRVEFFYPSDMNGKRILIAPAVTERLKACGDVVFLTGDRRYLDLGYSFTRGASIFVSEDTFFSFAGDFINRKVCVEVYKAVKQFKRAISDWDELFDSIPLYGLTVGQMIAAIRVFQQIGLIIIDEEGKINYVEGKRAELANSPLFAALTGERK